MRATNNAPGDSGQAAAARQTAKSRAAKQLEILALRTLELADRVACGELKFIDAVDVSYEAAVDSGLVAIVGDDVVQLTLAAAVANARRP